SYWGNKKTPKPGRPQGSTLSRANVCTNPKHRRGGRQVTTSQAIGFAETWAFSVKNQSWHGRHAFNSSRHKTAGQGSPFLKGAHLNGQTTGRQKNQPNHQGHDRRGNEECAEAKAKA